eukprot:5363810-Pleurochrysis_carterae.AAC.2
MGSFIGRHRVNLASRGRLRPRRIRPRDLDVNHASFRWSEFLPVTKFFCVAKLGRFLPIESCCAKRRLLRALRWAESVFGTGAFR